jgi:hypothetical protein
MGGVEDIPLSHAQSSFERDHAIFEIGLNNDEATKATSEPMPFVTWVHLPTASDTPRGLPTLFPG